MVITPEPNQGITIVDYDKDDEVLAKSDALDYMLILISGSFTLEILQYQDEVSSANAGQQDDRPEEGADLKVLRAPSASKIHACPTRMAGDMATTSEQGQAPAHPEAPVPVELRAGSLRRGCALMI